MATSRTTIIRGPGAITWSGVTLHDASGIQADIENPAQDIPSSISGPLDSIKTDQSGKVTFTPCGQITAEILAALYPHQTPQIGASLCGATDLPCVVHSTAGVKVTFKNAYLSKIPDLMLSPVKTAFGSAELTALLGLGLDPSADGALVKTESAAYAAGYPDPTGLAGIAYAGTYGGLSIPDTADGWTVSFELSAQPVSVDSVGTVDATLAGLTVRASCTPVGVTEAQILTALPTALGRGASLAGSNDLTITGANPGLTVVLKNARLMTGPLAWGSTTLRAGQLGFVAHRVFSNSTPGALYSVTQTAAV